MPCKLWHLLMFPPFYSSFLVSKSWESVLSCIEQPALAFWSDLWQFRTRTVHNKIENFRNQSWKSLELSGLTWTSSCSRGIWKVWPFCDKTRCGVWRSVAWWRLADTRHTDTPGPGCGFWGGRSGRCVWRKIWNSTGKRSRALQGDAWRGPETVALESRQIINWMVL